ncbi:uncharacterized protein LOC129570476 [Sitodiplosis mosellana]|uniref:uncharacterized protein LOC129570476 n=1 Tax=Sitodiplosis mosellana TaxID=263140 RepID=UPI00244495C3|nr:uncharacterized protein LOC129570476 [Sitodiplosis mosellana]
MAIRIGERFASYDALKRALDDYEKQQFANYPIVKSELDPENLELKYKSIRFKCKFHGEHVKTTDQRQTSTYKQKCESFVYATQIDRDGEIMLEIKSMGQVHNHERSIDLFRHMTKQRKAAVEANKDHLEKVLAVKANTRAVQKQVNDSTAEIGVITAKDIHNFKYSVKKVPVHSNDLVRLVDAMIQVENATVKVIKDGNELDCVFFQDARMKKFFDTYPEVVMFDGTYKLNDRRMPLVILLVIDGNGESQIAGLCVVRSENDQTFRNLFDEFKKENPKHTDIKIIMSDKASANASAFKTSFPNAKHQLCVFHVLQIFNREVTTRMRKMTPDQVKEAVNILRKMVYAESQAQYDRCYQQLTNMNCPLLMEYFNTYWHGIQEKWVAHYVNQHANYENRSNNRLESVNQKIKTIVAKYSSLASFFDDLITCIAAFNIERDHKAAESILRKSLATKINTDYDNKYAKLLTKYAFDKYKLQSMKSTQVQFSRIGLLDADCIQDGVDITVSEDECSCKFFRTMNLPCAHIIAFLNHYGESPYKPSLCSQHWLRERAQFLSEFAYATSKSTKADVVTEDTAKRKRNLTPNEKFNKASIETKKICEVLAEKSQEEFDECLELLKVIRRAVENNQRPNIVLATEHRQDIGTNTNANSNDSVPSSSDRSLEAVIQRRSQIMNTAPTENASTAQLNVHQNDDITNANANESDPSNSDRSLEAVMTQDDADDGTTTNANASANQIDRSASAPEVPVLACRPEQLDSTTTEKVTGDETTSTIFDKNVRKVMPARRSERLKTITERNADAKTNVMPAR